MGHVGRVELAGSDGCGLIIDEGSPLRSMKRLESNEGVGFVERPTRPSVSMSLDDDEEDYPEEVWLNLTCMYVHVVSVSSLPPPSFLSSPLFL